MGLKCSTFNLPNIKKEIKWNQEVVQSSKTMPNEAEVISLNFSLNLVWICKKKKKKNLMYKCWKINFF
jgi:hypothetical protein